MSDLEFAIDKLRKLEEDGRDFAFKLTNGFSDKLHVDIKQWASDVDGALTFMTKSMKKSATYEKSAPYGKLSDEVWHTVQILPIAVDGCAGEICTYEGEPYEEMGHLVDNKCYVDNEHMFDIMRHLNVVSERMSGSRCAAASSDLFLNEKKPYPLSIFVNDITTCYHSLLNEYDEIRKVKREKIGKCVVEEDTDKDIIDACAAWDETSEKFNRNKVYFAPEIYNPLGNMLWREGRVYARRCARASYSFGPR